MRNLVFEHISRRVLDYHSELENSFFTCDPIELLLSQKSRVVYMVSRKRPAPTREFIPAGDDGSSDEDLDAVLNYGKEASDDEIGLDGEVSDNAIYTDMDDDEDEDDFDEGSEDQDDEDNEYEEDEGEEENFSEFDDGDPNEIADEDDVDSDSSGDDEQPLSEEDEPESKKPRGLGELSRKLAALEEEIADLESKQISDKHWTLTGEVSAKNRPMNSLLEANVELPFGHMASKRLDDDSVLMDENDFDAENPDKPKFDIELIVRQRVASRTFDDVIRKKVETVTPDSSKPADAYEGLDFEKSQLGLADVYAKQYEKDIFNQSEDAEKKSFEKEEAKKYFAKLMHKLDSLTNFNFAPRPPTSMKSGAKDLPAMKLEEPIPLIISSSLRASHPQ